MNITKRVILYIGLSLLLLIVLYSYELKRQTNSPGSEGTIIISDGGTVFIVLDPDFEHKDVNLPIRELLVKYKDVGQISVHQGDYKGKLKNGQRVRVWISKVKESYPPTFIAIKLERI